MRLSDERRGRMDARIAQITTGSMSHLPPFRSTRDAVEALWEIVQGLADENEQLRRLIDTRAPAHHLHDDPTDIFS